MNLKHVFSSALGLFCAAALTLSLAACGSSPAPSAPPEAEPYQELLLTDQQTLENFLCGCWNYVPEGVNPYEAALTLNPDHTYTLSTTRQSYNGASDRYDTLTYSYSGAWSLEDWVPETIVYIDGEAYLDNDITRAGFCLSLQLAETDDEGWINRMGLASLGDYGIDLYTVCGGKEMICFEQANNGDSLFNWETDSFSFYFSRETERSRATSGAAARVSDTFSCIAWAIDGADHNAVWLDDTERNEGPNIAALYQPAEASFWQDCFGDIDDLDLSHGTRLCVSTDENGHLIDLWYEEDDWISDVYYEDSFDDAFYYVLNSYCSNIENGWTVDNFAMLDLCPLPAYSSPEAIGYAYEDVDHNGWHELYIGSLDGTELYEMYVMKDGAAVRLFSAGERSRWYWTEDEGRSLLANEGSNSAFQSGVFYYDLNGTALDLCYGFIADYQKDPDAPWFSVTDDSWDLSRAEPINSAIAEEITEKHRRNAFQLLMFPLMDYWTTGGLG